MLTYSPISSAPPGGQRDYAVDFSDILEEGELLATQTVTAIDSSILQILNVAINGTDITFGNCTIPANKGVTFRITVLREAKVTTFIDVAATGDGGTQDTLRLEQPIVTQITD